MPLLKKTNEESPHFKMEKRNIALETIKRNTPEFCLAVIISDSTKEPIALYDRLFLHIIIKFQQISFAAYIAFGFVSSGV